MSGKRPFEDDATWRVIEKKLQEVLEKAKNLALNRATSYSEVLYIRGRADLAKELLMLPSLEKLNATK